MDATDPRLARLSDMGACAYRLGMAFGAEVERAQAIADKLQYAQLFDRCFFAMRVGIALELRLKREARSDASRADRQVWGAPDLADREPPEDEVPERAEPEGAEPERLGQEVDRDRDRDREVERATLPQLLNTLQGVAADAAALPARPAEDLVTLRDLLSRYSAGTAGPPDPAPRQTHRARLAGSAAILSGHGGSVGLLTSIAAAPLRDPRPPQRRRATGPPPN